MRTQALYRLWLERAQEDPELHEELSGLNPEKDADAINDRFYRDLEFGTGGLRGVIGAGTNRMNIYVIRRATQGLCNYLKSTDLPQSIAIGYDSRIKSDLFAREAARVIAANGTLGGYSGGLERKRFLLHLEGHDLPAPPAPRRRVLRGGVR